MMRPNRSMVLIVLASLTICFIGAAYALWFNPTRLPLVVAGAEPTSEPGVAASVSGESKGVRLTVNESGIAAVSAAQLQSSGFTFSDLSPKSWILTRNGEPVPFLVRSDGEETILYFYAEAEDNPHEPLAVYELRRGVGIEMLERDAQPFNEGSSSGKHLLDWEENRFFVEDGAPGDAWMGPLLLAPDRWTLHLDTIEPDGLAATLVVRLFTNTVADGEKQHHIDIQVNDQSVAEHFWQGSGVEIIRVPLIHGILSPDEKNSVTVIMHDDTAPLGDAIYIDSLELAYDGPIDVSEQPVTFKGTAPNLRINGAGEDVLIFDITEPMVPVALTGMRLEEESAFISGGASDATLIALNPEMAVKPDLEIAPVWETSLRDGEWGADYIAIVASVAGFDEAITPLLAHRQEQGLRAAMVPVEQIYDEFGYGHRDPQAIKDFLTYAAENWQPPAPSYVLLVGDATYDVTNQVTGKNRNRLPTALVYSIDGSYVASDSWFVTEETETPQAAIGRFPAQNAPQLRAMVNKTIDYEYALGAEDGAWLDEVLLVADDEQNYDMEVARLSAFLDESGFSVYRLHMSQDDFVHHKIISAINQGVGLVNYMGDGNAGSWGDEAVLKSSDIQSLQNGTRLPILNTFTCRSGSFANPRSDSLAESLLRAGNGGIIAAVAPSGHLGEKYQSQLTSLFFEQLLLANHVRLGDSLAGMYVEAGETPMLREAMAPINLLGDPALVIATPPGNKVNKENQS